MTQFAHREGFRESVKERWKNEEGRYIESFQRVQMRGYACAVCGFCIACGTRMQPQLSFGRLRCVCPACGHIHFEDPKVAVGVVATRAGTFC